MAPPKKKQAMRSLITLQLSKLTGTWETGRGDVTFDNFVQACVTVKTLTDSFRKFDTDNDGWIQINYEDVSFFSSDHLKLCHSFLAI